MMSQQGFGPPGFSNPGSTMVGADTTPGFSQEQLQLVIGLTLRNPSFYNEVRESLLQPTTFTSGAETLFELSVSAYENARVKSNGTPTVVAWVAELYAFGAAAPLQYPGTLLQHVEAYIRGVCSFTEDEARQNDAYCRAELTRFLTERHAIAPLRAQLDRSRSGVLSDPTKVLRDAQISIDRIASVSSPAPLTDAFPRAQYRESVKHPTGIRFIDEVTAGGFEGRRVYGLFGPSGAFKTGTANQIAVGMAQAEMANYTLDRSRTPGLCIYAVYEGGSEEIQPRAVAAAADMPRQRVLDLFHGADAAGRPMGLSTAPGTHAYERDERMNLSEADRWNYAVQGLGTYRIADFSGSDPVTGKPNGSGVGYVEEITARVDRLQRETKLPVRLVVVDYAKLMVRRHMMARGLKMDHLRHYLSQMPDLIRKQIADPFDCSVLLVQQMTAQANRKAAGSALSHVDASEASDFGENLWYCFCVSAVDKHNNHTVQLTASKTRHTAGTGGIVMRINPNTTKLVTDDSYTICPRTHRIVPKRGMELINEDFDTN